MDIRKILNKKKLRGEEVGRALLAETIYSYKEAQKGKDTDGIFTPAERSKMVEGLTTSKDLKEYTSYKGVDRTIYKYFGLAQTSVQGFYNGFFQIWGEYKRAVTEESSIEYMESLPIIMTEKQYQEEREKRQASLLAKKISYQEIAYKALHHSISKPDSPVNKALDDLEGQQITNPRVIETYPPLMDIGHMEYPDGSRPAQKDPKDFDKFIEQYKEKIQEMDWEERYKRHLSLTDLIDGVEDPTELKRVFNNAEDGIDKKTLLEYIEDLSEWEALYGGHFKEFIEDYPAIYKALLEEITSHPELEHLKGVTDYQERIVPWEVLYKGNLYDYKELLESDSFLFSDIGGHRGISILKNPQEHNLDERGYYKPRDPYLKGLKHLYNDEEKRQFIQRARNDYLIPSYKTTIAINIFFDLLAERINMPELEIFKTSMDPLKERVAIYNELLYTRFQDIPYLHDQEEKEWKKALVKEVLTPIDLSIYTPTESQVQEARALLEDLSLLEENAIKIITLLRGGL